MRSDMNVLFFLASQPLVPPVLFLEKSSLIRIPPSQTNLSFGPLESPPTKIPSIPRLDYSFVSCLDYLVLAILSPCLCSPQRTETMPTTYYYLPLSPIPLFSLCIKNILHIVHGK